MTTGDWIQVIITVVIWSVFVISIKFIESKLIFRKEHQEIADNLVMRAQRLNEDNDTEWMRSMMNKCRCKHDA